MTFSNADLIGFVGVALVVGSYFLVQIGRMSATRPLYPSLNAVGAALLLYSLAAKPNPASIAIEMFWLAISLIGLARALAARRG